MLGMELSPVFLLVGFLSSCAVSRKYSSLCFQSLQGSSVIGAFMQIWDWAGNCWLQLESPGGTLQKEIIWLCRNLRTSRSCNTFFMFAYLLPLNPMPQIKGTHRRPNMPNNCTNGEHAERTPRPCRYSNDVTLAFWLYFLWTPQTNDHTNFIICQASNNSHW